MKIAILSNAQSIHTIRWATALRDRGLDIYVISFLHNEIPGVSIKVLNLSKTEKIPIIRHLAVLINAVNLRRLINSIRPEILHIHNLKPFWFYALALWGKPNIVVSTWGTDITIDSKKSSTARFITKWILSMARQVTATSKYLAKQTNIYSTKHIEVIPFGVDTDIFHPIERHDSNIVIGYFKGWRSIYGWQYLLHALKMIQENYPSTHIHLAGNGSGQEYKSVRLMVDELRLTNVVWLGCINNQNQLASSIANCDIMVMPSLSESFGVVALESSACGIPVIASNVGGVPEVVQNGITGYLVPPGNSDTIYESIRKLIENPAKRKQMGNSGRLFVIRNYQWKNSVNTMIGIYKELSERQDGPTNYTKQ